MQKLKLYKRGRREKRLRDTRYNKIQKIIKTNQKFMVTHHVSDCNVLAALMKIEDF